MVLRFVFSEKDEILQHIIRPTTGKIKVLNTSGRLARATDQIKEIKKYLIQNLPTGLTTGSTIDRLD